MNNFEKIKQMTVEEMAKWLRFCVSCGYCPIYDKCQNGDCEKEFKQWLSQEVNND